MIIYRNIFAFTCSLAQQVLRMIGIWSFILWCCCAGSANAAVVFTDCSLDSGLAGLQAAKTYSAAVGDYNLDGYPDFLISHHNKLSLWTNQRDGTFIDSTQLLDFNQGDMHGVGFIDFNNDGYPDISVSCGADRGRGQGANLFFVNQHGERFTRLFPAPPVIADIHGRGRSMVPLDFDNNGLIDLLECNFHQQDRPNRLAISTGVKGKDLIFKDVGPQSGISVLNTFAMKVVDLNNNGKSYFIAAGPGSDSGKIFLLLGKTIHEVGPQLGVNEHDLTACVPFDYDNDGDLDLLFIHRTFDKPLGAGLVNKVIQFSYIRSDTKSGFTAPIENGKITIDMYFENRKRPELLFLGRNKVKAAELPLQVAISQDLLQGKPEIDWAKDSGAFVWYDSAEGMLKLYFSGGAGVESTFGSITSGGGGVFDSVSESSETKAPKLIANTFYMNDGGRFVDVTRTAGLLSTGLGRDAIAADFNNDGFLDVYQVNAGCSFHSTNPPNELFLNQGNGTFIDIAAEAKAVGPSTGAGNGATALDYDNDGDLDLLLTNGFVTKPVAPGPVMLLRNDTQDAGDAMSLDLNGRRSNTRGWGARVVSRKGKSILYQQKSGLNGYLSTSDLPVHVGLGREGKVDEILVYWPSGQKQSVRPTTKGGHKIIVEPIAERHDNLY